MAGWGRAHAEVVRAPPPAREAAMATCRGGARRESKREEEVRDKIFLGAGVSRVRRPDVLIVPLSLVKVFGQDYNQIYTYLKVETIQQTNTSQRTTLSKRMLGTTARRGQN
jgi:hypothetical protein